MNNIRSQFQTISLIGMPGVGKSTVGVILAKLIGLEFTDTDLSIQAREGKTLQQIIDSEGHLRLREVEEEVLLSEPIKGRVLATGGSVIYSEAIMARLRAAGPVVYLRADVATLIQRVAANPDRGIASSANQTFEDIYNERTPLYERFASHNVDAVGGSADAVAALIVQELYS
ncbi:shikimate kinase [Congregibacter litoralis]|uniref:Shikimate kinase n=1 Tax=Congregibacter litoralis KT71 TaxID=314285 RepID=A4A7L7_9GAMM|nr:shikimate kinase [Congregibacter litoralis]EAQ98286.1 shikimate kinase [Congregibacter litoralis KT71]